MKRLILSLIIVLGLYSNSFAAVGCSLDDPDRDVKKLFPQSTGYKTTYITLKELGGEPVQSQVEAKLGDKFDNIYESLDVPYAYYTVLKGKDIIGYIHGVNQKAKYGGSQLIVASDLSGKILSFYYQKISSPESGVFRNKDFTDKFTGLTLKDFMEYDVKGVNPSSGKVKEINDPSQKSYEDFKATLRGIKKNLILMDLFLNNKKQ